MTKPVFSKNNAVYWILAGAVIVYCLLVFASPYYTVFLTGLYLIFLFLFLSDPHRRPVRVLLHLSPIVTYPLYFIFWAYMLASIDAGVKPEIIFPVVVVSYAVIYAMMWRREFWTDFPKQFVIPFLVSAAAILAIGWLYSGQFDRCAEISAAEKGVASAEIESCANLHLYTPQSIPNGTWLFRVLGLAAPGLILVFLTPFAYLPKKKIETHA